MDGLTGLLAFGIVDIADAVSQRIGNRSDAIASIGIGDGAGARQDDAALPPMRVRELMSRDPRPLKGWS